VQTEDATRKGGGKSIDGPHHADLIISVPACRHLVSRRDAAEGGWRREGADERFPD
jgi:hypothetical protein